MYFNKIKLIYLCLIDTFLIASLLFLIIHIFFIAHAHRDFYNYYLLVNENLKYGMKISFTYFGEKILVVCDVLN